MDIARKTKLLRALVADLCSERALNPPETEDADELWGAFRALVNTRPPTPAATGWLSTQDELLQGIIADAGISTLDDAAPSPSNPRLRLWRGDIMKNWTNDERIMIACCNDGTRPVVFKIERIDVPESTEDEAYLATHDFSCSKEDAYTG